MKILVVDDEIMQLQNMKIGLRTAGHSVDTALSAEEALERVTADSKTFDLIITDYLMPGITGMELLKAVRAKKPFIPVILMTAFGKKNLIIEAMQNQCDGFIEKPFSFEQLLSEIERVKSQYVRNGSPDALNDSLNRIVHQINNPLSSIQGFAELALCYETDPAGMKKHLEAILEATDHNFSGKEDE